ncbi:PREDICTED: LOW QUALITY PROTEIN: suppressor of cytokine signaling 2 [Charadrius vociferus]|nr:PREDICTED: LOW QUALITY PROTEIN: suppressor of cytokine signaling 2 [Charadrius vociferus]
MASREVEVYGPEYHFIKCHDVANEFKYQIKLYNACRTVAFKQQRKWVITSISAKEQLFKKQTNRNKQPPSFSPVLTGWYWGNMTVAEAKEKLQDAPEGTFLVRDSSHSEYLLTISVKTSAGPTNLRIEYQDGKFRLDSITCVRSRLKQFNSVVHLIEYYVLMCKDRTETPSNGTVHLYLNKPLYTSAPSLQHRCRITINKCTNQIWELPLPTRLKEYLKEYQYQV